MAPHSNPKPDNPVHSPGPNASSRPADAVITDIAQHQHGLITRQQVYAAGIDRNGLLRRTRSGRLTRLATDVFAISGAPDTEDRMLLATTLDRPGAVISHDTAAALWGLPGFRLTPLHILVRRDGDVRGALKDVVVHTSTDVLDEHLTEVRAIPATTPARTLYDLAGTASIHPGRIARLLDNAWSDHLVDHHSMSRIIDQHAERGRPGTVVLRELMAERPASYRAPESGLESRLQQILRDGGLDELDRQADVGDTRRWIGRVDFIHRPSRVVVQVDSERYHGSLLDRQRDAAQTVALEAAGYTVVRVGEFDVWHRPATVVSRLRPLLQRRAA